MDYREFDVPEPLRPYATCFWSLSGRGDSDAIDTIVPDGQTELIVHYGDRFSRVAADGATKLQSRTILTGQIVSPLRLRSGAEIGVVGLRFRPGGARAWLTEADEVEQEDCAPLDALRPSAARELLQQVGDAPTIEARVARRSQWVVRRRRRDNARAREALALADRISAAPRNLYAGASRSAARRVERLFDRYVGVAPRTLARIARFQRMLRSIREARRIDWSLVAASHGFFDQPHLIREFHSLTGTTPTRFLASTRPVGSVFE